MAIQRIHRHVHFCPLMTRLSFHLRSVAFASWQTISREPAEKYLGRYVSHKRKGASIGELGQFLALRGSNNTLGSLMIQASPSRDKSVALLGCPTVDQYVVPSWSCIARSTTSHLFSPGVNSKYVSEIEDLKSMTGLPGQNLFGAVLNCRLQMHSETINLCKCQGRMHLKHGFGWDSVID